jgi:hypothetical protein
VLRDTCIADEGLNLLDFNEEPDEYAILMLNMVEEVATKKSQAKKSKVKLR